MEKKKKILCTVLCVVLLCMAVTGCGTSVEKELEGTWRYSFEYEGVSCAIQISFNDGKVVSETLINGKVAENMVNKGTYTIEEDYIYLQYDNGNDAEIDYSFEDGKFTLDLEGFKKVE